MTDETQALDKALPAMDRTLRNLGVKGGAQTTQPSAVQQLLGGDSATGMRKDSAANGVRDSTAKAKEGAAADTGAVIGGVLSGLIQSTGASPGEYAVPETAFPRVDSMLNIPAVAR